MATTIQTIVTRARRAHLQEVIPRFWTDDELLGHAINGTKDLWRRVKDTYQDYFRTIDTSLVSVAANASTLTGVPADVSTVLGLEARTPATRPILFVHRDYLHPDFQSARQASAIDPSSNGIVYYDVDGAGAPVGAPTIRIAPPLTAQVLLTLVYVPVLADVTLVSTNPIPGESDLALEYWIAAHAIPKQRGESQPDPGFMTAYEGECSKLLTGVTPRDESEPEVVEAMFEGYWE